VSYLIVLPTIWPPYLKACLDGMDDDLVEHLLVVDNTHRNLGLAASWNMGARRVLRDSLDWLVILSAATRFGPEGGRDFVALLDHHDTDETWVLESSAPVNQHLFAFSRPCLERVGLFDENFFPIYGDDADISRRVHVAQQDDGAGKWDNEPVDAWIAMAGHATKLAGVTVDFPKTWAYYETKWGGLSGHETFTRPFGDPDLPLSFWPVPPDPRSIIGR
jgi:hypothetical protein